MYRIPYTFLYVPYTVYFPICTVYLKVAFRVVSQFLKVAFHVEEHLHQITPAFFPHIGYRILFTALPPFLLHGHKCMGHKYIHIHHTYRYIFRGYREKRGRLPSLIAVLFLTPSSACVTCKFHNLNILI